MEVYSTFPKVPGLDPHHQMVKSYFGYSWRDFTVEVQSAYSPASTDLADIRYLKCDIRFVCHQEFFFFLINWILHGFYTAFIYRCDILHRKKMNKKANQEIFVIFDKICPQLTHTHTHMYIYIYINIHAQVCSDQNLSRLNHKYLLFSFKFRISIYSFLIFKHFLKIKESFRWVSKYFWFFWIGLKIGLEKVNAIMFTRPSSNWPFLINLTRKSDKQCARETKRLDSGFDLIRSHQQSISWSPSRRSNQRPQSWNSTSELLVYIAHNYCQIYKSW